MEPVRWGVLSTALITEKVLAQARTSPEVTLLAVASRDGARAQEAARRWGFERSYGSYDDLLADPDVEAVYNPLPNSLHHPWTMRALAAGKHVLCEKPYSRRPAEVAEAFDLAEARGLVLSEAFMWRYNPQTLEVRRLVDEGVVGDLRMVVASFSWPTPPSGDVRLDPGLEGGCLMDVGVYCLSAARLFAGEPLAVTGQQLVGPTGVDVSFVATASFAGGVTAHLDAGFHLPDRSHLEVVGSRGTLRVRDPWHCFAPGITLSLQDEAPQEVPVEPAGSYRRELEEVGRALRGLPSTALGRADALGQARAVEALYRSAETGERVTLPS